MIKSFLKWALGALGALIVFATQTKPEDAFSNLQGWTKLLGVDSPPAFLAEPKADAIGAVIGFCLIGAALFLWWRGRNSSPDTTAQPEANKMPDRPTSLNDAKVRSTLISVLKEQADPSSNIEILFATNDQQPIALMLKDNFALAGWQTQRNESLALEPYLHRRIDDGIEVLGYSKHIVDGVAQALANAGFSGIRKTVNRLEVAHDNPKYPWCLRSVRLTIGRNAHV